MVAISIPDWGVTPFARGRDREAIARGIDAFNGVLREVAETHRVPVAEVTDLSRRAAEQPDLVAEDQLHLSGSMYASWVGRILPVVRAVLAPHPGPATG